MWQERSGREADALQGFRATGIRASGFRSRSNKNGVRTARARHRRLVRSSLPRTVSLQTTGTIRIRCPGLACNIRAALPREMASDMLR